MSSLTGLYFVVGCQSEGTNSNKISASVRSNVIDTKLNQFVSIGNDNSITLFNHRPEMGQGTFQSIPMIIAEELEVDIDKVIVRQAEANRALYGNQMVVGSRSIQTEFEKLRTMGATAREMLKQAAANSFL